MYQYQSKYNSFNSNMSSSGQDEAAPQLFQFEFVVSKVIETEA